MSVVSLSHLNLVRARKSLEKAYRNQDWDEAKSCDTLLTRLLDKAFDDPARDQRMLLDELEVILALYAKLVESLPVATTKQWLAGPIRH